jgi:hypothetical protein
MPKRGKKDVEDALLLALASGASIAAAAQQAQCSESTVRRRLNDAAFRARVHAARSEMVQAAVGRLATLGTIAADELDRLIREGKDDNVKLGAARAVFSHMLSGHEHAVLTEQLAELRRKVEELEHAPGNNPQSGEAAASAGSAADNQGIADSRSDTPNASDLDDAGGAPAGPVAEGSANGEDDDIRPLFA